MSPKSRSWSKVRIRAGLPVTASMRRTPAWLLPSETILNRPACEVCRRCVPPQNSRLKSPASTTRTTSPYFSPNSMVAPHLLGIFDRLLKRLDRQII